METGRGEASKRAKEERLRRWEEKQELWKPGATSRSERRGEVSCGSRERPGERMETTALDLTARG